jgi:hypothetical protein
MGADKKDKSRFSATKRDFLKRLGLFSIYIGPVMSTFAMADVGGKPTGPVKKKKGAEPDSGEVLGPRSNGRSRLA